MKHRSVGRPLSYLMGAYFHQDFDRENGTPDQVVAAFIRDDPHLVGALAEQLSTVLQHDPSEADLRNLSQSLGSYYRADWDGGTYRAWFESIEAQARAAADLQS